MLDKGKCGGKMVPHQVGRIMTTSRYRVKRYTRAKWVRFTDSQAEELERLAVAEGSDVSALVRRATLREFPSVGECDSHEEGSLSVTA